MSAVGRWAGDGDGRCCGWWAFLLLLRRRGASDASGGSAQRRRINNITQSTGDASVEILLEQIRKRELAGTVKSSRASHAHTGIGGQQFALCVISARIWIPGSRNYSGGAIAWNFISSGDRKGIARSLSLCLSCTHSFHRHPRETRTRTRTNQSSVL